MVTEQLPGGSTLKMGMAYAVLVHFVQKCFISGLEVVN